MATSFKFLTTNRIEGATLKVGGASPPRNEVTPNVMENAMKRTRRQWWQKQSAAALDVDFDLGADYTLQAGGLAGMAGIGGVGVASFTMKSQTGAYNPAGVWTDIPGRITVNPNTGIRLASNVYDNVKSFDSTVSNVRSVRFSLVTVTTVFTLAEFVVGAHDSDLTFFYTSLDATEYCAQFDDKSVGADTVTTYVGYDRERWSLRWSDVQTTTKTILSGLRQGRQSFWCFDRSAYGREFIVAGGQLQRTHRREFASDTLYDPLSMDWEQVV